MRGVALLLVGLLLLDALAELLPLVPNAAMPPVPNYASETAWLCRPNRADACGRPTTATVVAAGGARPVATYAPDPAAPIDCFYVYPTVSAAPGFNAPIAATGMEEGAARQQLARFSSVCRPFAPLYRQLTTAGLRAVLPGGPAQAAPAQAARATAYADVVAAFHDYLARDNGGRGFVLIGHSQGAKILARLIAAEIDGTPLQARLVAAIVPGTEVDVPDGAPVGGSFKHVPLCAASDETGCVIAYSTYLADQPVPTDTMFGTAKAAGMRYACVDPAVLAGTPTLDADLPNLGLGTDFVELPGALRARCAANGRTSVLAVAWNAANRLGEPTGAMLTRIAGYTPSSGLHPLDVNLALGTLVRLVHTQSDAYTRSRGAH